MSVLIGIGIGVALMTAVLLVAHFHAIHLGTAIARATTIPGGVVDRLNSAAPGSGTAAQNAASAAAKPLVDIANKVES